MVGQGWTAFLGLLFIPVYVRLLGIEAYGLIGVFVTLQYILGALDLGFTPTINRELASLTAAGAEPAAQRDLVRSLETVYWGIGMCAGLGIIVSADMVAGSWLPSTTIPRETVIESVILMGAVTFFQWPVTLYQGGLLGLQHHVVLNVLTVGVGTLRGVGAVAALTWLSPSVRVFFTWQLVVSIVHVGGSALLLWRRLPQSPARPRFRPEIIRAIARFALGVSVTGIASIVLRQVDKVVLSKLISLTDFGYYMLGVTIGGSVAMFGAPVYTALFPRLSALVVQGDRKRLSDAYHRGCQVMSLAVIPVTCTAALFAHELIWFWSGSRITADHVAPVAVLLLIGTALNNLVAVPYELQVAHGWTSLGVIKNLIAIVVFVPLTVMLVGKFGLTGGGVAWVLLNLAYVVAEVPYVHRRLLPGASAAWYLRDIGRPLLVVAVVSGFARWWWDPQPDSLGVVGIAAVIVIASVGAAASLPGVVGRVRVMMSGAS